METLFNGRLSIEVSAHGAELCSIFSNGKEYLWQADPAFWKRHSPVLFPIVGSVWENEYRNEDTTYVLTQHGFARDMEFTLISEENDEVRYQLVSNEETLKKYPFPFRLTIGYRIREKKVDVGSREYRGEGNALPDWCTSGILLSGFRCRNARTGIFRFQ